MFGISFSRRKSGRGATLHIVGNHHTAPIAAGQTLLGAAIKENIPFPHMCNVGECGACKCRLKKGHVRLRKDISHHVSSEELQAGFVLACQSVAESEDIEIEVPGLSSQISTASRPVFADACITRSTCLAPGILALEVELAAEIRYLAGQYAQLTVPGVAGLAEPRRYSFAEASTRTSSRRVLFHIRHVPGGTFTDWLFAADRIGARLSFSGPHGNFRYHQSCRPLLCVAAGTGLAPIKAILEQGITDRLVRDVTLVVGARTQRDLYALDSIAAIQEQWLGKFDFVPVLSQEPETSNWDGLRGHVTDYLRENAAGIAHCAAYLCGPPGMIDAALAVLQERIPPEHVHYDRFLDRGTFARALASTVEPTAMTAT